MIYVVYDTNVIVSAFLKYDSIPAKATFYIFSKLVTPIFCKEVIFEYEEVLLRQKFGFDSQKVNRFIKRLIDFGQELDITNIDVDLIDKKDIPFYKTFLRKRMDSGLVFLVTGNKKHFPTDPFILSPREFYDLVENMKHFCDCC